MSISNEKLAFEVAKLNIGVTFGKQGIYLQDFTILHPGKLS
ncbi:hypothetical protein [Nostoc sp. CHAB 5836]|nr:hypothetical protein [Nostoc sp. CHAB 5836]